ncbi:unnamed protein product [Sphagnum jensenii]|uniref:Kinesin motor domain-containing protein n=1 Tax=Sphagnum jensenii TaxID=128206 RepID=A0ABP1A8Y5_9BRYO
MVKGGVGRTRVNNRGVDVSSQQQLQWERDPFGLRPWRHKSSPILHVGKTPTTRKLRQLNENVPPDAPNNVLDGLVACKSVGKGTKTTSTTSYKESPGGAPLTSPVAALLPKLQLPKPSPARQEQQDLVVGAPPPQIQPFGMGHDLLPSTATKRKLNLGSIEAAGGGGIEALMSSTAMESSEATDTGVKVVVRVRPLNNKEEAEEATNVVQKLSSNSVLISEQQFTFDAVIGEDASQQAVFEMVGLPMVENCLAGFNSSIFAYGQTGSGKTHTMWGPMPGSTSDYLPTEDRGITPRIFEQLFSRIQQEERENVDKHLRYQCRCSFLEIYNEQITDLLEPSLKNLMIREDTKTGVYVESLTEEYVSSMGDVAHLLVRGLANRTIGSTSMNNESSRSHSVFTFVIESHSKSIAEGVSSVRSSRMNLVDLAGSERQKRTGAAGERLKEAGNINKSLSQLGNVINILAEVAQTGKQRHIPYRDSRLTFLLQESLGGNAKLAMICAISPASSCRNETLSTLRFAQRAKAMQNKAVVNEETANDVKLLREQIRQLKEELMKMKMNSNNLQENGTTTTTGFSNGWSARRSYNILRLSLGQPMTRSLVDAEPFDEKMEIDQGDDDDDDDEGDKPSAQSTPKNDDDDYQPSTIEMKLLFSPSSHSGHHHHHQAMRNEEIGELLQTVVTKMTETGLDSNSIGQHKAQEENPKSGLPSADLVTSHSELHMITPPELRTSILSPVVNDSKCSSKANMASGVFSISGKLPLSYSIRSSKAFSSSRDELAASLAHGLEILATQQRRSVQRYHFCDLGLQTIYCKTGVEGLSPPDLNSPDARDEPSLWQLILEEELNQNSSVTPKTPAHSSEVAEAAALADALRREQAAKEIISLQAAEIEELHCLMLQQEKFNECLDVNTAAKMKQQSLEEELQKYKTFCDLGEREALQQEITELRSQLQLYLETGTAPWVPTKQHPQGQPEATADKRLEEERKEWDQRESEWIVIVQELREESRNHKQLAEKWKKELEREKRCTREIHDALQLAMEGHARLLNQYAELQEKYTLLLAKVREIRDGVSDMKTVARRSDMNATEAQWFDIQSSQIVALKIELDREKKIAREEIQALHTQLQDTADAVQAAGELLVRLKEAEEATSIAKNAAAVAEEDAEGMRHEIKKLEKQHGTEVAILQQQLSDALSSKPLSSLCPKCAGMSGHINLECTNETGDDVPSAAQVAAILPSTKETQQKMVAEKEKRKTGTVVESWSCGEQIAEEDEDDEEDTMSFTTAPAFFRHSIGFQFLQNLDIEQFDDNDEFLCETCGEPATNSMRICDSCIPYMGPELRG